MARDAHVRSEVCHSETVFELPKPSPVATEFEFNRGWQAIIRGMQERRNIVHATKVAAIEDADWTSE